jgi:hypothetical protein
MGSIGASSISTLAKDLRRRFTGESASHKDWKLDPDKFQVEEVAVKSRQFLFEEHFAPLKVTSKGVQFGILIGGYSGGAQLSEVWTLEIKDGKCDKPLQVMRQGVSGAYVGGDPELFCRVANGYGNGLEKALEKAGVPASDLPNIMAAIRPEMAVQLVEPPMPIQDAIDLAEFFVNATATFTRFKRGAATVGGPVESAAITKHEGFKWVRRKHYFDETLNPRD